MEHCDSDTLALMAMGEAVASLEQRDHLDTCVPCQGELTSLRQTVSVARSTLGEGVLHTPSGSVWNSIHRELGLAAGVRPASITTEPVRLSHGPARRSLAVAATLESSATVTPIEAGRRRRSSLRAVLVPMTASAAAAALVAGGILWWGASAPVDPETMLASAQLDALPDWQGASGTATVLDRAGERIVSVSVDAAPGSGIREVWLLTPEVDGLISLGFLQGDSGDFVIPAGVDLDEYPIVDVSEEPVDGNPEHSGDSVVRGTLDV